MSRRLRSLVVAAAAGALLAAAAGVAGATRSTNEEPPRGEIVYAVSHAGRGWLEAVALDGGGARRLTPMPARGVRRQDVAPAWSPDGRRLSFVRFADARTSGVYVVARAGGAARRVLALDPRLSPSPPIWSANGRRLALDRDDGRCTVRRPFRHRLTVVRADGRGTVDFPALPQARRLTTVSLIGWSPDGARLLYAADRYDTVDVGYCRRFVASQLFTIRPDGTGRRRVATGRIYSAAWAPGGGRIAFVACDRAGNCGFEVVQADGTGWRSVAPSSAVGGAWTWISRRELLVTDNTEEDFVQLREAYVLDVDTGSTRRLATWAPGHCDDSPLLGHRRDWAALACYVYANSVTPARLKLLDTRTGREIDRPWPARPRPGSLNGFDVRLAP